MPPPKALYVALEPPSDPAAFLEAVPELSLARGLEGSPYHHLDTLDHVLEAVRPAQAGLAVRRRGGPARRRGPPRPRRREGPRRRGGARGVAPRSPRPHGARGGFAPRRPAPRRRQ